MDRIDGVILAVVLVAVAFGAARSRDGNLSYLLPGFTALASAMGFALGANSAVWGILIAGLLVAIGWAANRR